MFPFKRFSLFLMVFVLSLSLSAFSVLFPAFAQESEFSTEELQDTMRQLWVDHVVWTRLYIVSVAGDLPDVDLVAERLLQNQVDIGNAIRPFYGDEAADQLTQLLQDHIVGAVDILAAAKAGDSAAIDSAIAAWRMNADEIANFLSTANPDNWVFEDIQAGMQMHLDLTLAEAQARLEGRYADDIAAYEEVQHHILGFADVLSAGIIAQFADMFEAAG